MPKQLIVFGAGLWLSILAGCKIYEFDLGGRFDRCNSAVPPTFVDNYPRFSPSEPLLVDKARRIAQASFFQERGVGRGMLLLESTTQTLSRYYFRGSGFSQDGYLINIRAFSVSTVGVDPMESNALHFVSPSGAKTAIIGGWLPDCYKAKCTDLRFDPAPSNANMIGIAMSPTLSTLYSTDNRGMTWGQFVLSNTTPAVVGLNYDGTRYSAQLTGDNDYLGGSVQTLSALMDGDAISDFLFWEVNRPPQLWLSQAPLLLSDPLPQPSGASRIIGMRSALDDSQRRWTYLVFYEPGQPTLQVIRWSPGVSGSLQPSLLVPLPSGAKLEFVGWGDLGLGRAGQQSPQLIALYRQAGVRRLAVLPVDVVDNSLTLSEGETLDLEPPTCPLPTVPSNWTDEPMTQILVADFNGDQRPDITLVGPNQVQVLLRQN